MLRPEWQKNTFPPGGFPYTDKRTGHVFDATAGNLADRVNQVRNHRLANTHIYKSPEDFDREAIKQEIVDFMCARNSALCSEVDLSLMPPLPPEAPKPPHPCVKCGSLNLTPEMCVSCGGNRAKSWKCECGNVFSS